MRIRTVCLHIAAVLVATATLAAQRPDFNGKWALDEKRTAQAARDQEARLAGGGDAVLDARPRAERLDVRVDAKSLTLSWSGTPGKQVETWTLDWVDRSGKSDAQTTAKWSGRSIEIKLKLKGAPSVRTELSMDGAWLVVKDFQRDRDSGKDTGTTWNSRWTYYRRAPK